MAEAMRELRPLYKKLLRLAQSLPEPKRQSSIDQIRRDFRNHGDLTDPKNMGVQRYIYRNGQRVNADEFEEKGEENARWKTQDMEGGLRRHHQLLRRQYFLDRKSGPPRPIF
ncbi:hypothetical protein AM588_10002588 [Phytophthora nicotianae]|uniref:Complex 1 LYR protein domain-containing protein n=1 Tax=Phytophthora nicotianae TaxID=4792 RepID=A0A0W8D1R8_PHYNI|nr:hypothetical protein AM588_10002588 [Phytophthora nicotianae]